MLNYDRQLLEDSELYESYSKLISANESINSISLKNISVRNSKIESDLYITSFGDNDYDIIGIKMMSEENLASLFNLQHSEQKGVITSVYNYSGLLNKSSIEEMFIILAIPQNKTSQYVNVEQKVLSPQKLDFLSSNTSNSFSINKISSLIITTLISLFYLAGIVGYALLYRHMLNELKRKIF
jgi:hypothetical protein